MTAIFKSRRGKIREPMNHFGFVPILLSILAGIISGPVAAELIASQEVPSPVAIGEPVTVTVMLTYNGVNSSQALISPMLPAGVVSDSRGDLSAQLYPGITQPISYGIRAERSGTFWIVSQIAYDEDGTLRRLRLESPLAAIGQERPQEPQITPSGPDKPGGQDIPQGNPDIVTSPSQAGQPSSSGESSPPDITPGGGEPPTPDSKPRKKTPHNK